MASNNTTHTARHLVSGERITYQGAPSFWAYAFWVFLGLILLPGWGLGTAMGLGILAGVWLQMRSTELVITNKRLIAKTGFISRKTIEMQLRKIESIQVQQGIFGRILDFGTLEISGAGNPAVSVAKISDPMKFRQAFLQQQDVADSTPAPSQTLLPTPTSASITRTDPATAPPTSTAAQPEKDAWGGTLYDEPSVHHLAMPVLLHYTDQEGQTSKRQVDIAAYSPYQGGMVYGRCHLRNANRTFRFDRIQKAIDPETGEIIPDLLEELETRWAATPAASIDRLLDHHAPVLKMLLYTAKADGFVRVAELNVITSMATEITQDNRLTPGMLKSALDSMGSPSITSFTRTYNSLRRTDPSMAEKAAAACRAIIATQKTVHPNEQAVLDVLSATLPRTKKLPP